MTLDEIAKRFGVTRYAIQFQEERALAKLRQHPLMRAAARDAGLIQEDE